MARSAALLVACVSAAACGGGTTPAGPSSVQVPSPGSFTIALSGTVRDGQDAAALANVTVEIASGPDAGRFTFTDASGNFAFTGLRVGAFVVRFTLANFEILNRTVSASQDTRLDVQLKRGLTCVAPAVPAAFRVDVAGSTVTFSWEAVPGADDYLLGIGPSRGSSRTRSTNTTQTSYVWRGMPSGNYFARVVARNACGRSNASNEVAFTVGSPPQ